MTENPPRGSNLKPRDLRLEEASQREFDRLKDEGRVPKGTSGEPMQFPEFMEQVYAGMNGADAPQEGMDRTELAGGASVRVDPAYQPKPKGGSKSPRDEGRTKRAGKESQARAEKAGTGQDAEAGPKDEAVPYETPSAPSDIDSRAEGRKKLSELLEKFGPSKEEHDGPWSADMVREARAQELAERLGLAEKRKAMLELEDAFREEVANNQDYYKLVGKDTEAEKAYAQARLEWTNALNEAAESLDGRRKYEVHAIRIRDTILREEQVRQQGIEMGREDRADMRPVTNAVIGWAKAGAGSYLWATAQGGKGAAFLHRLIGKKEYSAEEKQQLEARYTKAARIITAAGVGTALFGGFGALGVGLSFGLRAARGTLGIAVGSYAAKKAGEIYREGRAEENRLALRAAKRTTVATAEDLKDFQKTYKKGNRTGRERGQRNVELLTALLTGAGFSIGTGAFINGIGAEAAQKAAEDLQDTAERIARAGGSVTESAGNVEAAAHAVSAAHSAPEVAHAEGPAAPTEAAPAAEVAPAAEPASAAAERVAEATIQRGEGFNTLFVELRASGLSGDSEVIKHLLDPNLSPSELSAEVHALLDGKSVVTQPGDKLFIDERGLVFERNGVQQLLMEDKDGKLVTHELKDLDWRGPSAPEVQEKPEAGETSSAETGSDAQQEAAEADSEAGATEAAADATGAQAAAGAAGTAENQFVHTADAEGTGESQFAHSADSGEEDAQGADGAGQPEKVAAVPEPATPRAPWEFPGISPDAFTTARGLTIDPTRASVFADERGNAFVFGGTYEQGKALAESYARANPDALISYEGSPIEASGEAPMRWTAAVTADRDGRVFNPAYPTNPGQMGRVPDPERFVRQIPLTR